LVAGDFDDFRKIRVRAIADFNRLQGEQLIALPGVRQTRTFFALKEVIDSARLEFERCLGGRQWAQKPEGSAEPTSSACALKAPRGGAYASRWAETDVRPVVGRHDFLSA
jgi:hypothetical protein